MRAAVLALLLVLGLTGCGGDDDGPAPVTDVPSSLTPTADPSGDASERVRPVPELSRAQARAARRAFDTWFRAYSTGNAERACPLQTRRFTQRLVKELAEQDRIQRGATCADLVEIVGILFEAIRLDPDKAKVTRAVSEPKEVAYLVNFPKFATLAYLMVRTKKGWFVDRDLTIR